MWGWGDRGGVNVHILLHSAYMHVYDIYIYI